MTGPGDQMAAGTPGYGRLRASHADREQVIGVLKDAFVQGLLGKNEFDRRVGRAFGSRTYAELAAVTAGIATALPGAGPGPARPLAGRAGACVIAWLVLVTATLVAALAAGDPPLAVLAVLAMIGGLAVIGGLAEARAAMAGSRYQQAIPGTAPPAAGT